MHHLLDFFQIVLADVVLSGDNALIIGMAAASLSPELRKKAIVYGMVIAAVLRIVFAIFATYLLAIKGLLFLGGLLLLLVLGLILAITLMGFGASLIVKLLTKYHWISYLGLVVLIITALRMLWDGWGEMAHILGLG